MLSENSEADELTYVQLHRLSIAFLFDATSCLRKSDFVEAQSGRVVLFEGPSEVMTRTVQ